MNAFSAVPCLVVLFVAGAGCVAQPPAEVAECPSTLAGSGYTMFGRVTDPSEQPIEGATVEVEARGAEGDLERYSDVSDEEGCYLVPVGGPHEWDLSCTALGYADSERSVRVDEPVTQADCLLERA